MEENRRTRLQQAEERLARLQEKKAPSVMIDSEEKLIAAHQQPVSARTLLSQILATLEQPILETEIPTERVKGQKGEFRIICQRPSLSGELEVIAAYTKVSDKEIAANISLGGHGEHVQDFICGIYRARCPELDETAVQTRSAADTAELMGKARDFARQYTERLMLDGGPRLNDFALDICPVWNAERAAVDFHFLEVQNGYAFEALKLLDAEAAARVTAGKERLTMGKRDVERGLLDGIALPDLSGLKLPRKQR
jgi:hypothetical protein